MGSWKYEQMDRQTDIYVDRWINGQMDRWWVVGNMNKWIDG